MNKTKTVSKRTNKPNKDRILTEKVFIDTIKELREVFVSKKDLERLVTKEDLELTKREIKEELNAYATKEDVKQIISTELQAYPTKEDLEQGFENFAKTDLAQATNSVIAAIEDLDERTKSVFASHDKRITALELAKN